MITPSTPWPFVGRERELSAAIDELADPASAGVLVVGPAGVGKTRLIDEVLARLGAKGRLVHRAVGAAATESIPFAAIGHLLPPEATREARPLDPVSVFMQLREHYTAALPAGERLVIGVDDVALLDQASLTVITQLINAGIVALLATVRTGHVVPSAISTIEGSHRVLRIDVGPLDLDGVIALLDNVLGGTVDRQTGRAMWTASQGNLLYVRELVFGALASGALVSELGHWHLTGALGTTSKLIEVVTGRLTELPESVHELAEILALAEPLRVDDLERAGFGDTALTLEAAGLISASEVNGETLVRLGHPLYGEVLRTTLTTLRRRSLLLRAADIVEVAGRSDDLLRVATWRTNANATVDPEVLKEAVFHARAANDFALTEQLARVAVEQTPDLDMWLLLGEAIYEFGRVEEADEVLAAAAAHVRDDGDRLRLAVLHNRLLFWASCNAAGAISVLEDAAANMEPGPLRALVGVSIANTLAFDNDPRAALEVGDALDADDTAEMVLSFSRSIAHTRLGNPVLGASIGGTARRAAIAIPREDRVEHPALYALAECLALAEVGRLREADELMTETYRVVAEEHIPQLQSWLTMLLGRIALHRGRPATARRWFAEGLAIAGQIRFAPGIRSGLSGLAVSAGQLADVHAAATLLAELDQLEPDIGFAADEVQMGRGWALAALGRISDATDALLAGAESAAATGDTTIQLELLYEAARISGDGARVKELLSLDVSGDLAAARAAFVRGLANHSPADLEQAEIAFLELGAQLAAAEAAAALARELTRSGRPRDGAAVSSRAAAHRQVCEGASTPMLLERGGASMLTARELEIAQLAARGLASKAIARELGVTERTVSNHLQNAYVKLGISTRADLVDALGLAES